MDYKHLTYYRLRIGNALFHISKYSVYGKVKYRTTRMVIKEKNNG